MTRWTPRVGGRGTPCLIEPILQLCNMSPISTIALYHPAKPCTSIHVIINISMTLKRVLKEELICIILQNQKLSLLQKEICLQSRTFPHQDGSINISGISSACPPNHFISYTPHTVSFIIQQREGEGGGRYMGGPHLLLVYPVQPSRYPLAFLWL